MFNVLHKHVFQHAGTAASKTAALVEAGGWLPINFPACLDDVFFKTDSLRIAMSNVLHLQWERCSDAG